MGSESLMLIACLIVVVGVITMIAATFHILDRNDKNYQSCLDALERHYQERFDRQLEDTYLQGWCDSLETHR